MRGVYGRSVWECMRGVCERSVREECMQFVYLRHEAAHSALGEVGKTAISVHDSSQYSYRFESMCVEPLTNLGACSTLDSSATDALCTMGARGALIAH
jgi:hypothetical protein